MLSIRTILAKYRCQIAYSLIAGLALFLHLYKLADVPYGLHLDEAGMAYDAFCLARYGVARDLTRLPVYLMNYGSGQSALYAYFAACLIRIFGLSTFVIRLPGAIFSGITIVCGSLIIREGLGKKAALPGALLLTIMPYFVMQSRFGLDCNLFLGASTLALYLLIMAVKKQRLGWFALAGLCMGGTLYAYALSYIVVPLYCFLSAVYLLYTKKVRLRQVLVFGASLFVIALPLILFVFINTFSLPPLHTPLFSVPVMPSFRSGEIVLSRLWENIVRLIKLVFRRDHLPYNAFDRHFTLYLVSTPFIIIGFLFTVFREPLNLKRKKYSVTMLVFLFLCSVLVMGVLMRRGPNINRVNGMYYSWAYITIVGIVCVFRWLKSRKWFPFVLAILYGISFLSFSTYYFTEYPTDIYPQRFFYPDYNDVCQQMNEIDTQEKTIFYTTPNAYVYYALANKLSPYELNAPTDGSPLYEYQHNRFREAHTIDQLDEAAIYVVWETESGLIRRLEDAGFTRLYEEAYLIFSK